MPKSVPIPPYLIQLFQIRDLLKILHLYEVSYACSHALPHNLLSFLSDLLYIPNLAVHWVLNG